MDERRAVEVLRELRDTGDVSDWREMEAALDHAIATIERVSRAPVGEVTREDWLENFRQFGADMIGQRVRLVPDPQPDGQDG